MDTIMAAQENVALAWSLFDLGNNHQSDPAWLDKLMAAFATDSEVIDVPSGATLHGPDGHKRLAAFFVENFPDIRVELTNAFATEDQVTLECTWRWNDTSPLHLPSGSSSKHEALGRTAVLSYLPDQEWEDRECPPVLRYADTDGTTRSRSCMGAGDGVTSPARFSCSMRNAVGNSCRVLFAGRTGAFLEQTDGGGTPFQVGEDHRLMEREFLSH